MKRWLSICTPGDGNLRPYKWPLCHSEACNRMAQPDSGDKNTLNPTVGNSEFQSVSAAERRGTSRDAGIYHIFDTSTECFSDITSMMDLNTDVEAELLKILGLEDLRVPQPPPAETNFYPEDMALDQICLISITYINALLIRAAMGGNGCLRYFHRIPRRLGP